MVGSLEDRRLGESSPGAALSYHLRWDLIWTSLNFERFSPARAENSHSKCLASLASCRNDVCVTNAWYVTLISYLLAYRFHLSITSKKFETSKIIIHEGSLLACKSNCIMAHVSVQVRNVLINKIYRKAILLSPTSRQKSSTGQIITMVSNDTKQLQLFLSFINNITVAPFQILLALALAYQQVGVVMFIGLGFIVVLIPINGFILVALNSIRRKKVVVTDARVKLINEILSGIRVIKYYAWEQPFTEKIAVIRNLELQFLKQMAYIIAVGFTLILEAGPIIQPILVFLVFIQLGNSLDAATAFTTISLFNIMQQPFAFLPLGLAQYSQSLVSTRRMLDFFNAEELNPYVTKHAGKDGNKPGFFFFYKFHDSIALLKVLTHLSMHLSRHCDQHGVSHTVLDSGR